ncbi:hypothetical protein [Actinocorallia sp. A-T 12471]|uniref:hypothetical protein n=1 Tax=Actinocorallia sp. A-T 12471 TaxID=3089813 RepID=UPI0029CB6306|nr:hypothetical protein [Actinocorallia sp. A-T 12471]MDX6742951.1 hypothetical protein [Actinocorallia sp. A-T 12471]
MSEERPERAADAEVGEAAQAVEPEPTPTPTQEPAASWHVPAEGVQQQQFAPGYAVPPAVVKESAVKKVLRAPWAQALGAGLLGGVLGGVVVAGAVTVFDGGDDVRPAQVSRFEDQGGFPGGQGGSPWGGGSGGGFRMPGQQDGSQQDGAQQGGSQQQDGAGQDGSQQGT